MPADDTLCVLPQLARAGQFHFLDHLVRLWRSAAMQLPTVTHTLSLVRSFGFRSRELR